MNQKIFRLADHGSDVFWASLGGLASVIVRSVRCWPVADAPFITSLRPSLSTIISWTKIRHVTDGNIISDGIVFGSVQVPTSGDPIVMMADGLKKTKKN